jgi:hypothetical protein
MESLKSCQQWDEKLAARHPDDCSADEQRALNEHVASCQDCAATRAQYAALSQRIQAAVASEQVSHEFVSSVTLLEPAPSFTLNTPQWRRQPQRVRPSFAQGLQAGHGLLSLQ